MGCPVDKDLVKLISVEVANLEKEVKNIRNTSTDEAKKIWDALQTIRDEINEYDKRIADIEKRLEKERKERLEKQEEMSGAIGDISSDVTKLEKRQDISEENISQLEGRQSDLETTVSSVKDEQAGLASEVGALKIEQTRLDSRVKALEEGSLNATADTKIFQVPSRNPCFCGRDSELETIAAQLKNTGNGCVYSVICGLGGVGKTSLAVEFLCQQEGQYPGGIFWISGENNNIFQRSLSELARQIGTFENAFSSSLSRTLEWLRRREESWCLVVDNLDELEMSTDMRKLLTGHWKHAARGHIIITTRREVAQVGEETGIEEQCCIELKCLTEEDGIQFLRMRTGKAGGEDSDIRELVRELGGLPLALDQAGAYIRCLKQSIKEYVKKYKKQKLLLLKKKTARLLVEDTSPERLAVHTTWLLNFDHISRISEEMSLEEVPILVMQVCAFLGPDDIPYELINEGLNKEESSTGNSGSRDLWDQSEVVSLLTKFSLFQRFGTNSFNVHRLVQEVIRSQLEKETQEMQELRLDVLVKIEKSDSENANKVPNYFIDIPLKDRDYKLISHCMRQHPPEFDAMDEADSSQKEREEEANQLREEGNYSVQSKQYEEALKLYSSAIGLSANDYRLFCNRALCYLKLGQPQKALDDCEKCLSLNPNYSKALQRKAWALQEVVENGSAQRKGQKKATLAVAIKFVPDLYADSKFCKMFPELPLHTVREIHSAAQLAFALMTTQENETLFLHEGEYNLNHFVTFTDLQIVGLGQDVVLTFKELFIIFNSRCYFENIVLPEGSVGLICQGKDAAIHMNHCKISGGYSSCEDFPECDGGPGCIAASLGKPVCNRTGKFGYTESRSGVDGFPGVQIVNGSSALIENCVVHNCGGGGILVVNEGSQLEVRKCDVFKNHQAGLEARDGGKLIASENRIFNGGFHGVLIGPNAGECDINDNKIFENAKEGILATSNINEIVIRNNDIHHNRPFGISLDSDSRILISDNKIFENGFWGILAKSRTSAHMIRNVISGNKCGGIFIGVNYSGRVHLESNIVRDHSGPWLEYQKMNGSFPTDSCLDPELAVLELPPGENKIYSIPPVISHNKEFNNEEGMYHPTEVVQQIYSGCTFCHRPKDDVRRLLKCPTCHIASYCCKECQRKHWPTHKTLCVALKSRYSVTVKIIPFESKDTEQVTIRTRMFGSHLKGIGTGPKPKRNSRRKFIVKIQTQPLNSHPLQLLSVYDKSLTLDGNIQSTEIFSVIMECGVLGLLNKFTSKKVFFWAMFAEKGEKLTIFLDHLAPYQEW